MGVVDVATHVDVRPPIVAAALRAGKHVLSQKPFADSLDEGRALVALADELGLALAVNQNGRWAPHFSYARAALDAGLLGELVSADFAVHWDHNWTADTAFDALEHLILHDFAIHWFDIAIAFAGGRPARRVFASVTRSPTQRARPPLLAQVAVEFDGARAAFVFQGDSPHHARDTTTLCGSAGALHCDGPDLDHQTVTLTTAAGSARPELAGTWFPGGFHGTMAELLCAIEDGREPLHSARGNLDSLALCFAACASAKTGEPVVPGAVERL